MLDWIDLLVAFYVGAGFSSAIICFSVNSYMGHEDDVPYWFMACELFIHALLWPILIAQCILEMHHRDPDLKKKKDENDRKD